MDLKAARQAAGNAVITTPVYLRLVSGSSVYGDAINLNYGLFGAQAGGTLVTDASPTGLVNWLGAPTVNSNVGSYDIAYGSGIVLGNTSYSLSAGASSNWTITPRPLNLSASKTYDRTALFNSGFLLSGLVNGDPMPGVTGSAAVASRNVGTSTSLSDSTLAPSNPNYTLVGGAVSATILPRPITITGAAQSKVYGDADPALGYRVSSGSLVDGDALQGLPMRAAGENVGMYTTDMGALANANYAITHIAGALDITPRPLNLSASKTYDGTALFNSGFLLSGLVNADALPTVTGSASVASPNAGNSSSLRDSTLALSDTNYTLTGGAVAALITPRAITVAADALSKVYGNPDPLLTWRVSLGDLIGQDRLSGVLSRAAGEATGPYAISAAGLGNSNYAVGVVDGTLSIMPAVNVNVMNGRTTVLSTTQTALARLAQDGARAAQAEDGAPGNPSERPVPFALRPGQAAAASLLLVRATGIRLP